MAAVAFRQVDLNCSNRINVGYNWCAVVERQRVHRWRIIDVANVFVLNNIEHHNYKSKHRKADCQ